MYVRCGLGRARLVVRPPRMLGVPTQCSQVITHGCIPPDFAFQSTGWRHAGGDAPLGRRRSSTTSTIVRPPYASRAVEDWGTDVLIVGEVDTGLLRGRDPSSTDDGRRLVDLVLGERVLVATRPRGYVRSPERPVGVDCPLGAPGAARQVRGIGTALQRAAITDREVVQGSAYATLVQAGQSARQPWSHYLARPGFIETVGRTRWAELADSLAAPERPPGALDLGAVARRATDDVQASARGGGADPFR